MTSRIYVHNIYEPLKIENSLYKEIHSNEFDGNKFETFNGPGYSMKNHHYLSDINLDHYIWKNAKEDIIGKFQVRKWLLTLKNKKITEEDIKEIFSEYDIMCCPIKTFRMYSNKEYATIYEQYCQWHASFDLRLLFDVIYTLYGNDEAERIFDWFHKSTTLIYANLYVAKRDLIMEYYDWMFPVLKMFCEKSSFELYKDKYQQRAPGYIAERLLSYYILTRISKNKIYSTIINEDSINDKEKKIRFSI